MKPLLDCPYFQAWVAITVQALSDMPEHSCGVASKEVLTSTATRIERLSSPCMFLAQRATARDIQFALANLEADFGTVH